MFTFDIAKNKTTCLTVCPVGYCSRVAALPLKTSMLSSINVAHTARLLAVQRVTITHVRFLSFCMQNN